MDRLLDNEANAPLTAPLNSTVKARWERKMSQPDTTAPLNFTTAAAQCATPRTPFADKLNISHSQQYGKTPKTNNKKTPSKTPKHSRLNDSYTTDRFIPTRSDIDLSINLHFLTSDLAQLGLTNGSNGGSSNNTGRVTTNENTSEFKQQLANSMFNTDDINSKILSYKQKAPKPSDSHIDKMQVVYTANQVNHTTTHTNGKSTTRYVASNPERILDAPDMVDDYYLNLLDWSAQNCVAVGLGKAVYLWDATTGTIDMLCELRSADDMITSVQWMSDSVHLAVGTNNNVVQLWNVSSKKQVRSLAGHSSRIGSMAWNQHVLSTGSRDNNIHNHDVRVKQHHISTYSGHQQEVCGLKYSSDGKQLASGSNDNTCKVWDVAGGSIVHTFTDSIAAVKAVAWCPYQPHTLATGSGTADRHIRLYNTATGVMTQQADSHSQVCSLLWNRHEKELISAHGFTQNQLTIWRYPSMQPLPTQLTGHTARVLHMALSPDGTTVCSAAADETLRFWVVSSGAQQSSKVEPNRRIQIPSLSTIR